MIDPARIWSSKSLPTLPTAAVRLIQLAGDPEAEVDQIVAVVRTDPAISAKILRAANSSLFAFRSQVTSIERAVPLLGITPVTSLALSFSLVDQSMARGPMAEHFRAYWMQSVVQGCAAEFLGERIETGLGADFFLVGLLLDVGRLAMLKTIPADYRAALELAREARRPLHEVERELLGIDHVEVGQHLLQSWQLPESFAKAAMLRHASVEELEALRKSESEFDPVRVAAVAAALGEYFCTTNNGPALQRLRELAARLFDVGDRDLERFVAEVRSRIDDAADAFAVDASQLGDPGELMASANEHLANLTLRAQAASTQAEAEREAAQRERIELERRNRELLDKTTQDPLTKIHNRAYFDETLAREIAHCERTASVVGVVFGDVDRFKTLNDTFGHKFGDEVLIRVAAALKTAVRRSDVVARYGGEEFVVLAVQPTEKGLANLCDRLRTAVEALDIRHDGQPVPVTISIGAAFGVPSRGGSGFADRLVTQADQAMYEAKHGGRNRVEMRCLLDPEERELARLAVTERFSRWLVREDVFDVKTLSGVLVSFAPEKSPLGELAVTWGFLGRDQVAALLADQRSTSERRIGDIARDRGLLSIEQLGWLLAQQHEPLDGLCERLVEAELLDDLEANVLRERYLAAAPPRSGNGSREGAGVGTGEEGPDDATRSRSD